MAPFRHGVKRSPTRILASVPQTDILIECANCGRVGHEAAAKEAGWRYWSDGVDLHLICPLCASREFAPDAPASADLPMPEPARRWLLACGHEIPLLDHERPDDPASPAARMCLVCGKLRNVVEP